MLSDLSWQHTVFSSLPLPQFIHLQLEPLSPSPLYKTLLF